MKKSALRKMTYTLIGVITLLTMLLAFSVYNTSKSKQNEDARINNLISNFEKKFKKDSINLVKYNKILIDRISQKIIDSITIVYEEKLKTAYKNGYLTLSNDEVTKKETKPKSKTKNKSKAIAKVVKQITKKELFSNNVLSYKDLPGYAGAKSTNKKERFTSNVTSYSKLKNNSNSARHTSNVTSYSKLKNTTNSNKFTSNVTTYSKLNRARKKTSNSSSSDQFTSNVTTYTKVNKPLQVNLVRPAKIKPVVNRNVIHTSSTKLHRTNKPSASGVMHNDSRLNSATNINDIESSPIYPGCANKNSEDQKKNCLAVKMSNYVISSFNSSGFSNIGLSKGVNNLRVLFIIDKNGNSQPVEVLGKWHSKVKQEANRVIRSIPKMIAGKKNGQNTVVKYSFKIPFIVN